MGAHIARTIEQVARRIVDRWQAFENLLIGDRINFYAILYERPRRAAPGVQDRFYGRAVQRMQRDQGAGAVALAPQGRRVDDEQILENHPHPGGKIMGAVRAGQEFCDPRHLCGICGLARFRTDRPAQPLDLVLARLDHQPQQIIGLGQRAQIGEGERLIGAGRDIEIVTRRKIPLPPRHIRRRARRLRRRRAEPVGRALVSAIARGDFDRRKGPARQARAAFGHGNSSEISRRGRGQSRLACSVVMVR